MMNKRILITGAAGFLGSHLTEHLIFSDYFVFGIDNFFRGKKENLATIENHPNFHFEKMDLSDTKNITFLHDIFIKHKIDTVIHLAAINGTQYFYDSPLFVFDQNIKITQNMLAAVENSCVKKISYSSSSEVYGDPNVLPTPETESISLNALADRDSYAASKAIGDFYVRLFCEKNNLDYLILRIFNLYGDRMVGTKYGQVIPEFIEKLRHEKTFTIIGDGSNTRSFCDIHDAVTLMHDLIKKNNTGIINVGNDHEITILELAKLIHKIADKDFHPVFLPKRPNDHLRRCPDIRVLKTLMPNFQFTSLEKGLLRFF